MVLVSEVVMSKLCQNGIIISGASALQAKNFAISDTKMTFSSSKFRSAGAIVVLHP